MGGFGGGGEGGEEVVPESHGWRNWGFAAVEERV